MLPESLIRLVGQPVSDIDRIVMTTRGGTRFRWLVLVEATFVLLTVVLLLPVVLAALGSLLFGGLGGDGDGDGDGGGGGGGGGGGDASSSLLNLEPGERYPILAFFTSRFSLPTLHVSIEVLGRGGDPLWSGDVELPNPDGYDPLLGGLLKIARLQQVPLDERMRVRGRSERIGRFEPHTLGRGRPDDLEEIRTRLPRGCELERGERCWTLTHTDTERVPAFEFFFMLVLSPIAVLVVPRRTRHVLVEGWRDLVRVQPRTTAVTLRPQGVHVRITRGSLVELDEVVRARTIQAFHMAPRMTREPALVVYGPAVRLVHESGIIRLPPGMSSENRTVQRVLTECLLDLWSQVPQAAPRAGAAPVRCRACERSSAFEAGRNCPWCGGVLELVDIPVVQP